VLAADQAFHRCVALPGGDDERRVALVYTSGQAETTSQFHVAIVDLKQLLGSTTTTTTTTTTLSDLIADNLASQLELPATTRVNDVASSARGSLLCIAAANGSALLFDVRTAALVYTLRAVDDDDADAGGGGVDEEHADWHTRGFTSARFLHGGSSLLLTGSFGKSVLTLLFVGFLIDFFLK
jgi:hypothetical protein